MKAYQLSRDFQIIAELGTNWRSLDQIITFIKPLRKTDVSALKLQIGLDVLYSRERAPEEYTRMQRYKLTVSDIECIVRECNRVGLDLWASIFDIGMIEPCAPLLAGLKVASSDLVYDDLVREMAKASNHLHIPLMLSTGACTDDEVCHAIEVAGFANKLILMQCKSEYPSIPDDANIRWPLRLMHAVDAIGYSDHVKGCNLPAQLAYACGYTYFEKHVRIEDNPDNPDNDVAIDLRDMRKYVLDLYDAQTICGSTKEISPFEILVRQNGRRGPDGRRPA